MEVIRPFQSATVLLSNVSRRNFDMKVGMARTPDMLALLKPGTTSG
jgi:hypothetical protein